MFKGAIPALITPFTKDNRIDGEGLRRNIAFVEEGGVAGIVPCGTTGESATLSALEHEEVIDIAVECSKVPVIAGTGSNNTEEALQFTKHAADAGVDCVLLISPYYNKPNSAGLLAHFRKIAEAVDIPMILYNVPSRTGQDMPVEVITELAKVENIVGIKEASGNLAQMMDIITAVEADFSVLSGDDFLTRYQAVVIPGGFSWGDHLGAGRVFGIHLVAKLAEAGNGVKHAASAGPPTTADVVQQSAATAGLAR